jgi:hypothetical protein
MTAPNSAKGDENPSHTSEPIATIDPKITTPIQKMRLGPEDCSSREAPKIAITMPIHETRSGTTFDRARTRAETPRRANNKRVSPAAALRETLG